MLFLYHVYVSHLAGVFQERLGLEEDHILFINKTRVGLARLHSIPKTDESTRFPESLRRVLQ